MSNSSTPQRPAFAEAVVMIDHRGQGGGSGCYLGEGWVITCQHLFRDDQIARGAESKTVAGRVSVTFPSGHGSEGVLIATDTTWDLALLKLRQPPADATWVEPSGRIPAIGQRLYFAGYGGQGELQIHPAAVTGFGGDKLGISRQHDTLILAGAARQGDSGGPILTGDGKLAGVLWGSSQTNVVGTQIGRVWEFVKAHRTENAPATDDIASRANPPQQITYQPGCPSGQCPLPSGSIRSPRYSYGSFDGGRVSPPASTSPPAVTVEGSRREVSPSSASCQCDWKSEMASLRDSLKAMQNSLATLEQRLNEQADHQPETIVGPVGPTGPVGPAGPQGPAANIDLDQLAEQVKQRLAGSIRVRVQPK